MKETQLAAKATDMVIVDGVRTPFMKMGSDFAAIDATEQGRVVVQTLLSRTGVAPEQVDELIFGCASQPPDAANVARVIALRAGLPVSMVAMTVHRNCGSGLEALTTAADRIAAGRGEVFIVGGTENMTRIPLLFTFAAAAKFALLARAKTAGGRAAAVAAFRPGDFAPVAALRLGLSDPISGLNMGQTAEVLAREFGITREAQDAFAVESHRKAAAARELFAREICPVYLPEHRVGWVNEDNGIREPQTMEALSRLEPVFEKGTGTVTAGNSSQISDGAVALLVMTRRRAEAWGLTPLGRWVDHAWSGCDPARMGLGPAYAIRDLYDRTGLRPVDADTVEINEAFAAQVLAVRKLLNTGAFDGLAIPEGKLNPSGGSIALGHPVGATGARLVLSALHFLKAASGHRALVSLCVGGGQGGAAWLETID